MDCAGFEDLLFQSLDARPSALDEERMRKHAQSCGRCAELAVLMSGDFESVPREVPVDLVAGVLDRTTGGSCGRAQMLLAEGADRALGEEGGLLAIHLGTCTDCATVARALVQLRHELPALAEIDPGEAFVAEVMAATVGATAPHPDAVVGPSAAVRPAIITGSATTPRVPLLVRVEEMWERIAQRPRLALEGAYAGIVVFLLVFGLPSQSLAELPVRAFGGVRQEGIRVERAVSSGLGELVDMGRGSWTDSSARAAEYFAAIERAPRDASRVERGLRAWAGTLRDFAVGVWDALLAPLAEHLRALWLGAPTYDAETDRNR